ncbi:CPBP family intramembrane glutamic endopeptidase [Halomicrococcus sp. NG-SE-24]|uniref:CPBP family intramembrane glutamic endopeptidase n=1 Tax=Halomicrococcus sp. NG-SE-24 TaxID=3436928 RepID=UPI003D978381
MSRVDRSRLGTFFGVLIGLVVLFAAVSTVTNIGMIQLAPLYMFTPLVAAAVTVWRSTVSFSAIGLRLGRYRWLAVAAVAPIVLAYVVLGLALAVPGITFDPGADLVPGLTLPSGVLGTLAALGLVLVLGVTVNAVLAFGEEAGWRGYLLWELAPLSFWRASLLIGAIWGLWHAPIIIEGYNYPSFPVVGVAAMTAATITFSFVYTYLVVRARSVLAAVFFHGVFNASGGLIVVYTTADTATLSELIASPVGVASMVVFLAVAALIYYTGTPDLTRSAVGDELQAEQAEYLGA